MKKDCACELTIYLGGGGGGGGGGGAGGGGVGGGIQLPQLPLFPPPSSLGGGAGAGTGAPFVLPDFSPCPQVHHNK